MSNVPTQHTDVVIVGSGIAGLLTALHCAEHARVTIITKRKLSDTNTQWAQGGISAVSDLPSSGDSSAAHIQDTLQAGEGLCIPEVVRSIVEAAPIAIHKLLQLGVHFDQQDGTYRLAQEGGHSHRRIYHATDRTGAAIMDTLIAHVTAHPQITVLENHIAIDLITDRSVSKAQRGCTAGLDAAQCVHGIYVLDRTTQQVSTIAAHATCLATGGAGKVYRYTTNPDIASGDGLAMAYRAGARLENLEFVQFHPTCLFHPQERSFLISEAMRGEGGTLRRVTGERFMHQYDERAELATRDVVARAIDAELKRYGHEHVLLDMTHLSRERLHERFPKISARCAELGIDVATQPIPVVPAAHYCCGGIASDLQAHSTLRNLLVCGEVAHTGLHGANRLASNSLMEGAVMAERAAQNALTIVQRAKAHCTLPPWDDRGTTHSDESVVIHHNWDEVRRTMWNYVGIVRSDKRLARAAARIRLLQEEIHEYYWNFRITSDLLELRNLALVAELFIQSAQTRRESRGLHYNIDCPEMSDHTETTAIARSTSHSIHTALG